MAKDRTETWVRGIGRHDNAGAGYTAAVADVTWTSETMSIVGATMPVARAGSGMPLLVLHHDIGTLERLPFYDALARDFTVLVPSHPGYDKSELCRSKSSYGPTATEVTRHRSLSE